MDTPETSTPPAALERLLIVTELADCLGEPVQTIHGWRVHGKRSRAFRFGRRIEFAVRDVSAWLEARRDPLPTSPPESSTPGRG